MIIWRNYLQPLWRAVLIAVLIGLVAAWACFVSSCATTVRPDPVASSSIAYEGNEQNAGFLGLIPAGGVLTEHKKAEYDALVELYGRGTADYPITPPVDAKAGLARVAGAAVGFPDNPWVWIIDREHLAWFKTFREWQRAGRPPR